MTPAARIAATIELLTQVEGAPRRPADAVANDYFRARRFIGSGDRRAVSERVWAVLRHRRRLDWWLGHAGAEPTPRLLTAAELLVGESWRADGVAQAFSGGRFGAAPLDRGEAQAVRALEGHNAEHPDMPAAVRLEVSDWMLPLLHATFGERLAAELAAMATPAPLDLRANLLKTTRAEARAALAEEGIDSELTVLSPWGLRVAGRRPVTATKPFTDGRVEIQDEGSQIVVLAADARPGMRVADICAGAGGKTLALAMAMHNRGHIAACDVSAPRLEAAVKRLRRAGVQNVEPHQFVAGDKWVKRRAGTFDRVLADAPCTGTGTWRRNPDARLRTTATDLAELVAKQASILDSGARLVKPGGRLIYATCSLLAAENEDQIAAFLSRTPGFAPVPHGVAGVDDGPLLRLTPARHGTDGFFAAVLERAA